MNSKPSKIVSILLMYSMVFLPIHDISANSDDGKSEREYEELDHAAIGRQGQAFGNGIADIFKSGGQVSLSGNTMAFPGGESVNISDLYPDTNNAFPEGYNSNVEELKGMYDSEGSMDKAGSASRGSLFADANSENPSISGSAYKVLLDAANRSRPDMTNDPIFNASRETLDKLDVIAKDFGDCSSETNIIKSSIKAHVPEYERCQRIPYRNADCEASHVYDASVIKHYSGPFNLKPCTDQENCTQLWIGRVGDNYWGGWCKIYEEITTVQVTNPEAIVKATLEYAAWDDYMQVWIGPPGQEKKAWWGPDSKDIFPPETSGSCERNTNWRRNPNVDLTQYFKSVEPGEIVNFKIRVSVSGAGEGFGRVRILYDPKKAVVHDEWEPESCMKSAMGVIDGFASGSVTCTSMPTLDSKGCTEVNGIKICSDALEPSPIPGVSNMCRKVRVIADYDFNKGQMECWTDPQGDEHCPENKGENLDSCKVLENNPQCGFIKSECISGAEGASGTCYATKDTYDCGTEVEVPTLEKETTYECAGPIKCMGDDCIDIAASDDQSGDFARATALLNTAQFMTQDMQCTGVDEETGEASGNENVSCTAFSGEAGECKIAVGGVSDCCEKPEGVSMSDYLTLIMAVPKLDGAIMSIEDNTKLEVVKSAYDTLRSPVIEGWTEVTKPVTGYVENISGAYEKLVGKVVDIKERILNKLTEQINKLMTKVFNAVNNALGLGASGTATGTKAGEKLAKDSAEDATMEIIKEGALSNALSTVMTIYTAYTLAITAIKMIYKCEQEEFTMNSKRELKSCSYVGSYCNSEVLGACIEEKEVYCCFSSPLSRIVQEQARPQLLMNFGTPESPQCGGIPLEKISEINWDEINLDEWLGILQQNGQMPDPSQTTFEILTGSGSDFNFDGLSGSPTRLNAVDRTNKRLEGIDVGAKNREAADLILPYTGEEKR